MKTSKTQQIFKNIFLYKARIYLELFETYVGPSSILEKL